MSFFNVLTPQEGDISLMYDIASGTVGGALIKSVPGKAPELIYTHRQSILFQKKPTSAKLISEMLKSLDKVSAVMSIEGVKELHSAHGIRKIKQIFYTFSSPWVISQTKIISYKNEHDILITRQFIESLIKNEEKKFAEIKNSPDFSKDFGSDTVLIEHKAIAMKLNGYETSQPVGKKAHLVEIPFYISAVGDAVLDKIQHTVAKYFNFRKSIAHSFTLLSYSTLRDVFSSETSFLTIDINGELTDLGIVKEGVLLHTASFPLGINSIIRHLSHSLATTPSVAESMIQMYLDHKIEPETETNIRSIFTDIQKEWLELFHNSLSNLGNDIALPKTLFLIVNNNLGELFAELLRKEKFSQSGFTNEAFSVVLLDSHKLKDYCHFGKKAAADTFLALETIAINKMINVPIQ